MFLLDPISIAATTHFFDLPFPPLVIINSKVTNLCFHIEELLLVGGFVGARNFRTIRIF
jgi:hypothetical protein